jgi:hypothetical protein
VSADRVEQLLSTLLGPSRPEVGCDKCFEHLDRFVELELAARDAERTIPGVRAHFEGCLACGEEHRSLHAFLRTGDGPSRGGLPRRS